jgi:hypothetical protein
LEPFILNLEIDPSRNNLAQSGRVTRTQLDGTSATKPPPFSSDIQDVVVNSMFIVSWELSQLVAHPLAEPVCALQ